ncbi:NAD(P)-dependent oxidoreductase [Georgenia yuyongxinii]
MRIALLGGTGRTGQHVLDAALDAGHDVVALTRASVLPDRPGLVTSTGDARDAVVLRRLVDGADAVVSALGPRGRDAGLQTAVARAVVGAMTDAGVRRFVGVSVAGMDMPGDRKGHRGKVIGALARTVARGAAEDRRGELETWLGSGLDWTLVRVPRLLDGDAEGEIALDAHVPPRATTLPRVTLARALVRLATGRELVGQAPFAADGRS